MTSARKEFRNRYTGEHPTPEQWERMKVRAHAILANPYAAPELSEWAMEVLPCGVHESWDLPERRM